MSQHQPHAGKCRPAILICAAALLFSLSLFLPGNGWAQGVPVADCCTQALDYRRQYEHAKGVAEATREQQKVVIRQIEDRAAADLGKANATIRSLGEQIGKLNRTTEQLETDLATQRRESARQQQRAETAEKATQTVQAALDKERPRTAVGKAWKGVGVAFKYIGIATVTVGGAIIVLTR